MNSNVRLALFLGLGMAIFSCSKDDTEICDTTNMTYNGEIASLLNSSCAVSGCHVDGNEANAWFSLEGYDNAKATADYGRLVGSIRQDSAYSPMPNGGAKLADCSIDKIEAWVDAGALNNRLILDVEGTSNVA